MGAGVVALEWVREWLHQRFHAFELRRRAPRRVDEAELRASPDAQAAWLTVLTLLQRAVRTPFLRFVRTPFLRFTFVDNSPTARLNQPVNVDLVLDVGNSRTCGMLMETSGDDPVDMNDSYRLELRDLSQPERVYDEPFPSRVEFVRGSFGDEKLSRRSGRTSAFLWPTATRVGYEAQALSYFSHGTEGSTGLSGPKRYLLVWPQAVSMGYRSPPSSVAFQPWTRRLRRRQRPRDHRSFHRPSTRGRRGVGRWRAAGRDRPVFAQRAAP